MKMTNRYLLIAVSAVALSSCAAFKGKKKTPVLGQRIAILASENDVVADKTIAGVEVLVPPATANESWAQPGGNPSKALGQVALGTNLSRVWTAAIDGGSNRQRLGAAPVVAGGRLYTIDVDATIHAFSATTGTKVWATDIAKTEKAKADKKARGARFGGQALKAPVAEPDVALHPGKKTQPCPQQAGLARAIGPDDPNNLAGANDQTGRVQNKLAALAGLDAADGPGRRHARQLRDARQASKAKAGAPNRAVTTPSFSS